MLVARRDPVLDQQAHDFSIVARNAHAGALPATAAPRFARLMTALQMAGTVLAIPVGLASGYSIYRANFSPEATCQGLRANIISMLDKNADRSTLRMLVRSDVVTFEHSCGTVDPDAVRAFKTLLTTHRPVAAAARRVDAQPRQAARVSDRSHKVKQAARAVESRPQPDAATASDASWLAAVRRALVRPDHDQPPPRVEAALPNSPAPAAALPRAPAEARPPAAAPAPVLPATASVADGPANEPISDHPVPPALIPDVTPGHRPPALRLLERIPAQVSPR